MNVAAVAPAQMVHTAEAMERRLGVNGKGGATVPRFGIVATPSQVTTVPARPPPNLPVPKPWSRYDRRQLARLAGYDGQVNANCLRHQAGSNPVATAPSLPYSVFAKPFEEPMRMGGRAV